MSSIILDGLFGNMLVAVLGLLFTLATARAIGAGLGRSAMIYLWHSAFALLYIRVLQDMSGDARGYYSRAIMRQFEWRPGSGFVQSVTAFLANDLGLSFTGISLAFATAGAVGLVLFDHVLRRAAAPGSIWTRRVAASVVFLPSASFWTSSLGKDSIAMLATGLFLLAATGSMRQRSLFALAVVGMFCVRPHMAALMVAAIACASILSTRWRPMARIAAGVLALAACTIIVPVALDSAGLGDSPDQLALEDFVAQRQNVNLGGGSSIDIAAMNPAERVFAYLFRPLPFESSSLFSAVAGAENALLLAALLISLFRFRPGRDQTAIPLQAILLAIYAGAALLILSQTTANLGIAVRQKWMILPMLLTLAAHFSRCADARVAPATAFSR